LNDPEEEGFQVLEDINKTDNSLRETKNERSKESRRNFEIIIH
jgi:hypothetical protein